MTEQVKRKWSCLQNMAMRIPKKNEETWIYLIHDPRSGYYKIGQSIRPWQRLKQLLLQGTLLPFKHEFVLVEAWKGHPDEEKEIHRRLEDFHVRGEWFDLQEEGLRIVHCYFYDAVSLTTGDSAGQQADRSLAAAGFVMHPCVPRQVIQLF